MIYNVLPFDELRARQAEYNVVITTLEPYNRAIYKLANIPDQVVIREWFGDITSPSVPSAPTRKQIQTILSAARWLKGDLKVAVACAMGISRSSATCLALLAQEEGDVDRAFARLMEDPRSNLFRPNELIVSLADDILNLHGKLLSLVRAQNERAWDFVRLTDNVDDQANETYMKNYFLPEYTRGNWRDKFTYKQLSFEVWLKQVGGRMAHVPQVPAHDWRADYEAGYTPREAVEDALTSDD